MNNQFGTMVTLSEVIHLTRELISHIPMPDSESEEYFLGLNLIDNNTPGFAYGESLGFLNLIRHHHNRSNVWTWLSVATVTAGAVAVCIFCPGTAVPVISGAVEIGKAIISNQK